VTDFATAHPDFVRGDETGLAIPAHGEALRTAGTEFLTDAFHAFGSLHAKNRISRITRLEMCPGGSTGQKLFLSVEYERPEPRLHTDLFVKFSRDFADPIRDRGRFELQAEVGFASLSRLPDFPISVPVAYFADYHAESGTGILITQRIAFGADGIEPHRQKCLDHEQLTDPLTYYRAIVTNLARLAAAHKSGRLSADIDARFPFDPDAAIAADKIPYDERKLRERVARYADFAANCPQLVPGTLSPEFFTRLDRQVGGFLEHEATIKRFLHSDPALIALCHWNAHIDNAWFWRDDSGTLQCGLMDWGRVRQLNVAYALWGCLSGAGLDLWDNHLDELLALFAGELQKHGGPRLDTSALKLHLDMYVATMGLAWLLTAPVTVLSRLPEARTASGPRDPIFRNNESARNQLHISSVFLHLWRTHDFGASLDRLIEVLRIPSTGTSTER
jgi:hypothetical protein